MGKKAFFRGLLGFPLGIAMGHVISVLQSFVWAEGYFVPCVPSLVEAMGSEIAAVVFQTVLCGILGAGFAAASVVWQMERWSLARQTGTHFLIISLVMLPVAYVCYWMEHTVWGFVSYFAIFLGIFILIWLIEVLVWRMAVKAMNGKLKEKRREKE